MTDIVIVNGARTAMGGFQGSLASVTAPELGATVIKEAVARAGLAANDIEEVIMGCVLHAGLKQGRARQASGSQGQRRGWAEPWQGMGKVLASQQGNLQGGSNAPGVLRVHGRPDAGNALAEGMDDGGRGKQHVQHDHYLALESRRVQVFLLEQHVQAWHGTLSLYFV